jgi:hypothetical protein
MANMLTENEQKELTLLNFVAFDTALTAARKTNTRIPTWFCSSEETKQEYRNKVIDALRPALFSTEDQAVERFLKQHMTPAMEASFQRWKDAEAKWKEERANNNPQAFFA